MIPFYYHPTPNPAKVALFLEEAGLAYEVVSVDTKKGRAAPECLQADPSQWQGSRNRRRDVYPANA
jgi:GST-like protein